MVGHIVGGGPVWPLWVTGALLFGGAVAAMAVPKTLRRACLAVAGVGLVSTVVVYTLLPSAPIAPQGLTVRIVAPKPSAAVTSPVLVRVCGGTSNLPGAGRLLSISVDGRQVAEVNADTAVVPLAPWHLHAARGAGHHQAPRVRAARADRRDDHRDRGRCAGTHTRLRGGGMSRRQTLDGMQFPANT